ncbi:MAG: GNAT family N-acetyltransferase [Oscillospiraceae bacterium]|nr:GNAT family N-acetyltransferase [Oscillospiraceae bacterium]
MDGLILKEPTEAYAEKIEEYRSEFPADRERVTYIPDRIPGLDRLEEYHDAEAWLRYCAAEKDRVWWYMLLRPSDEYVIGFCCLRRRLEYDDDDIEFASHIGYSVRPSQQRKGFGKELLRMALEKARKLGLTRVRLVCSEANTGSRKVIAANGGIYVDSILGVESGITVFRYDVQLT